MPIVEGAGSLVLLLENFVLTPDDLFRVSSGVLPLSAGTLGFDGLAFFCCPSGDPVSE